MLHPGNDYAAQHGDTVGRLLLRRAVRHNSRVVQWPSAAPILGKRIFGLQRKNYSGERNFFCSFKPDSGATTLGDTVTLTGANFASSDCSPTATLGVTICTTVQWFTTTTLSCYSGPINVDQIQVFVFCFSPLYLTS